MVDGVLGGSRLKNVLKIFPHLRAIQRATER